MIPRCVIAFGILVSAVLGVAWQRGQVPNRPWRNPTLLAFKGRICPPCDAYVGAYYDHRNPWFREQIKQRWHLYSFYADQRPDLVRLYRVTQTPTYIVIDTNGRELRRVVGFTSPQQLIGELTRAQQQISQPSSAEPQCEDGVCPVPVDPPKEVSDMLRANESLQKKMRQQTDLIDILKREALQNRNRHDSVVSELQAQINALQERAKPPDPGNAGRELSDGGAANGVGALPIGPDDSSASISAEILERVTEPDNLSKWARIALTIAAPEVAIPGSLGLTAAGLAFRWWRKRRKGDPATKPDAFPAEDHLPLPRNLDEARELLRLRQKEGRHAIHDGLYGALADAELEKLIEAGDTTALKLRDTLQQRMNQIAPLSTHPED